MVILCVNVCVYIVCVYSQLENRFLIRFFNNQSSTCSNQSNSHWHFTNKPRGVNMRSCRLTGQYWRLSSCIIRFINQILFSGATTSSQRNNCLKVLLDSKTTACEEYDKQVRDRMKMRHLAIFWEVLRRNRYVTYVTVVTK